MIVVERQTIPQEGTGKLDYSKEVALGGIRPGLELKWNQALKNFALSPSDIVSPYPWVKTPLPANGTHTAVADPTVMTDAAANFIPSAPPLVMGLIGMTIQNVTDGSSGVIIANTANTVTVTALTGGVTNRWNTNDVYAIVAHLVDGETFLAMPYTVPAGYTLAAISVAYSLSEDALILVYVDTFFFSYVGLPSGGKIFYAAEIVGIGSHIIDPTGASAHPFDLILVNQGAGDLVGTVGTFFILEAVGTNPLPTTKTVKCKFCGHEWVVPRETKAINCPNCGKLNIYLDLTKFRGTP